MNLSVEHSGELNDGNKNNESLGKLYESHPKPGANDIVNPPEREIS